MIFRLDAGLAHLDGVEHRFVAHLVVRNWWWGRAFVVMNSQWLGPWLAAPRAHPGDGLLDIFDVSLPLGQVAAVKSRIGIGAHLPHPGITERRTQETEIDLGRRYRVYLDGRRVGRARHVGVRVLGEAWSAAI
ncbi:MAG: hypothetical protein ACT4OS_07815 [Acidimicrobiales bacterium]